MTTDRSPIRVYLLDDHAVVRRGLRAVLELEADLEVVGESGTVADAVPEILRLAPDVAVLDGRLPDGNGIEVCRQVRSANPGIRALILTSYDDDEALFNAILAGSGGYVLKQVDESALVNGIRAVHQGQSLIDPAVAVRVIERMRAESKTPEGLSALTEVESQILDLITDGLTNKQIGEQLHLAEKTVKNHVTSLLAKLGVQRRTQAAVLASQLGRSRRD
ncbi:DNA-binding response regulator, NarL/FixJ family, contains REC and HTH domains [Nocardioides exalbidus]|uniref:DNA-binding response regulator, NarL/FixJ family, contains REC and HTH domains n=1 Tax=Nocardioides exalbidus TaxID=402596 RepID=A0A1H4N6H2_9ACTN|nr:response regulator transcription factor [Nocardioides exalbidus]SEB90418.1 DNA-binding response regulator, NarL/FixJ family, contains REC and HTH domains [Nocardioides exalbidus]